MTIANKLLKGLIKEGILDGVKLSISDKIEDTGKDVLKTLNRAMSELDEIYVKINKLEDITQYGGGDKKRYDNLNKKLSLIKVDLANYIDEIQEQIWQDLKSQRSWEKDVDSKLNAKWQS